jgi:ACT domain
MTIRIAVRLWLPDRPGRLAAVTQGIAEAGGNVLGLEVVERSDGVAVDELMVEVASADGIDDLCRAIQAIDGAGVEEARQVPADSEERGLQVISAAITILETANPTATLSALSGLVGELFDAGWTALVDLGAKVCVESAGETPPIDWLIAFCQGAGAVEGRTTGSGVMAGTLADANLAICVGRAFAFRRREQRELDMLSRVADRMCRPLRADRIPQSWTSAGRWIGS